MRKSRFTEQQIAFALKQAERWNLFSGANPVSKAVLLKEIREEPVPVTLEEERLLLPAL